VLYVQLDVNWVNNPKVARAGLDGAGLHAVCMCLAKSLETDGWIDLLILSRYGSTDELVDRLVGLGLLERDGERVRPHDWLERNMSQAAIDALREAKKEAGRRGNHNKWHDGEFETCARCNPEAQVVAGCDQVGSQSHRSDSEVRSPEPEVPTAIAERIDLEHHPVPKIPDELRATHLAAVAEIKAHRAS
jgi:hypothetical protein